MTESREKGDIVVGLARASIYGVCHTDKRLVDDVDVRVLVARGSGRTAVLAVADLCNVWDSTCLRLRDSVADALGVPREHVGISATQNHSAEFALGDDQRLDPDKLDTAFVDCARDAAARARPVETARLARPAPGVAICGRLPLAGFDPFLVYYGYRVEGGRADGSHVVKKALTGLSQGVAYPIRAHQVKDGSPADFEVPPAPVAVPAPLYAPPAHDELLQALFFRTPDGEPVGSVIRFALHPIAANRAGMDWQSGDLCAYARRRLEAEFGGTALYVTGPSQDQYPLVARKSLELAREVGQGLADVALGGLRGATWERGGPVAAVSRQIDLPLRDDYPSSPEAAKKEQAILEARIKHLAAEAGFAEGRAPGRYSRALQELRRLSDRYSVLCYMTEGQLYQWSPARALAPPRDVLRHPLFAMRIGRTVIAVWPGEPFGAWSVRLRDETIKDDLVTLERTSWPAYSEAPECQLREGEPGAAPLAPPADLALRQATLEMIAELLREGNRP